MNCQVYVNWPEGYLKDTLLFNQASLRSYLIGPSTDTHYTGILPEGVICLIVVKVRATKIKNLNKVRLKDQLRKISFGKRPKVEVGRLNARGF